MIYEGVATMPQTEGTGGSANAQEMGALLEYHGQGYRSLRRGDVVDGVVVKVDRDEVLVDIGAKSEAIVPSHEIPGDPSTSIHVGDEVVAYVLQPENQEGHAIVSLTRAQSERGWRKLQKLFEEGQVVDGEVVEHNKGGLIVNVQGVRGFVPLSQLVEFRRSAPADETTTQRLQAMTGRRLHMKIIEINRRRNRLILSERAAVQEERARMRERLFAELQPGQRCRGTVTSICDFGVFIDLGGADGLVHLSELSWGPVSHPREVVKVGDEVEVHVLNVDRENKKIALSLKRVQGEPWARVPGKYHVGQMVTGRVTKLTTFGAFAELEPGLEGLIHISELSEDRITHPKQVVQEGDVLRLKIIRIEPERKRLGLSLRLALQEETEGDDSSYGEVVGGVAAESTEAEARTGAAAGADDETRDVGAVSGGTERRSAATGALETEGAMLG